MTQAMTNIETPEGWERSGPCFIREHGGRLAVMSIGLNGKGFAEFYEPGPNSERSGWLPLPEAVAWANDQLGVPKPVEVVRVEYKDAWILPCEQTGRSWRVSKNVHCRDYADIERAISEGDAYVRGDA